MNDVTTVLAEADKANKVNWDRLDTKVVHEGKAITLPGDPAKMPIGKAIEALARLQKQEEQEVQVYEIIDAFPFDALVAFVKAMQNLYGWASPVPTPGFFSRPPVMISVKTGPGKGDVIQCPFGSFQLPGVDNLINTQFDTDNKGRGMMVIHAKVKQREKHLLLALAEETRRIVLAESIYRGMALRLSVDEDGVLDQQNAPEFLDVSDATEDTLLFNAETQDQINTNILVPMKETERCRKLKIPRKRGILLEGPYGTGKSLTARMAAKVATDNGWTFILLDRVQGLKDALEFGKRYEPAIVFAEDIDRIATERDEATNDLINTIDGVVSKNTEIMTVLTTNFAEKLNPVILRPGRLDAVISLRAPDAATVQRLIRYYAGKLMSDDEDLTISGKELEGQIPASIRECVERAKLGMVGRNDDKLSNHDIVVSAQTMKNHLALLNRKQNEETHPELLARSLKAVIGNGAEEAHAKIDIMDKRIAQIHHEVV